jgi:hypothetical protein
MKTHWVTYFKSTGKTDFLAKRTGDFLQNFPKTRSKICITPDWLKIQVWVLKAVLIHTKYLSCRLIWPWKSRVLVLFLLKYLRIIHTPLNGYFSPLKLKAEWALTTMRMKYVMRNSHIWTCPIPGLWMRRSMNLRRACLGRIHPCEIHMKHFMRVIVSAPLGPLGTLIELLYM